MLQKKVFFLFLQGISVQNDKYKIIIKVGSSYIKEHLHAVSDYKNQSYKTRPWNFGKI